MGRSILVRILCCAGLAAELAACAVPPPGPTAAPVHAACPHLPRKPDGKPPPPPASGFAQMLQPGHWEWDDGDYRWHAPRWVVLISKRRPRWIDGSWQAQGAACVWREGHFSSPPGLPG